jgi:copper chaperone CopZ
MCSNAIQKSLQTLPFIESIEPDLKSSSFQIQFKNPEQISIQSIKNRVEDAGFSVAALTLTIALEGSTIKTTTPFLVGKQYLCLTDTEREITSPTLYLRVMHASFLTEKKWKQHQKITGKSPCISPNPASVPDAYHVLREKKCDIAVRVFYPF